MTILLIIPAWILMSTIVAGLCIAARIGDKDVSLAESTLLTTAELSGTQPLRAPAPLRSVPAPRRGVVEPAVGLMQADVAA